MTVPFSFRFSPEISNSSHTKCTILVYFGLELPDVCSRFWTSLSKSILCHFRFVEFRVMHSGSCLKLSGALKIFGCQVGHKSEMKAMALLSLKANV